MTARHLSFPHNLTPGQRRCIEAIRKHGTFSAAAGALQIAEGTLANTLKKARMRGDTKTTAELVRMYRAATAGATTA